LPRLTTAGLCLAVALVFLPARASAQVVPDGHGGLPPSDEPGEVEQQAIVEVQVHVRSEDDAALLQSQGYSCAIGPCRVELPDGEEQTLMELGFALEVEARAIKLTGPARPPPQGARASSVEVFESGANSANYAIADGPGGVACGATASSDIVIGSALSGAVVTKVVYSLGIAHGYLSQLNVWLQNDAHSFTIWSRFTGGVTDEILTTTPRTTPISR
jgi:hypothetical protein